MMITKNKFVVFLLITLLTVGTAGQAEAQFWKRKKDKKSTRRHKKEVEAAATDEVAAVEPEKLDKRELRRREKQERKRLKHERKRMHHKDADEADAEQVVKTKAKKKKKHEVEYPATQIKERYRIDFLASLYLDELVKKGTPTSKDKIPEKAFPGISFYEGLNIAADSLKKAGYNIDIFVHDISDPNEAPATLITNGRLDSADLIIGAFHSADVPLVAAYAQKRQINFVSALSPADGGVKDNQFFTMVQPSLKTHCEWIVDDVSKKFPGSNVILLHRAGKQVDENAFGYLNNYNDGYVHFKDLICNGLPEKISLQPLIETEKTNVVVIAVLDPRFADSLLQSLSSSFPDTRFEVYGMPSWNVISDLHEDGSLPNLSVNVTMPFNIDQEAPITKYVNRKFKNLYGGKATELVYRGYETMYWYSSLLKRYGTIFNLSYSDNSAAPFTKYDIRLPKDKEGNALFHENTHIYLYKYGMEGGNNKID
jgi:hypothetical protein